jgi:cellulose synthase/poly-beta-1,6-N-acetylglucosamine synthase-like glycosyltransferase
MIALPVAFAVYAFAVYPLALKVVGALRSPPPGALEPAEWPFVSICLPAYNEEASIRVTLDSLLALDYPADRRQILVVSDASTDRTDEIVGGYARHGVELLRLPTRGGKTAAENAAVGSLRGEIVVNTDATIRILPDSLKALVRAFGSPSVGLASGRDVSVGASGIEANTAESEYVGYEMWVRRLETRIGSIVGASGCFYAIRRSLQTGLFPSALSRDFAAALLTLEAGYRAVSVDEAPCLVARTAELRSEFRRKTRTMARGLETLWYKRALLNPFRYGVYSWMLGSHKLARWLVFLTAPGALVGLALLAPGNAVAASVLILAILGVGLGLLAMNWPRGSRLPRLLSRLGFVVASFLAGFIAWSKALRGELNPVWEPTRRPAAEPDR